MRRLPIGFTPAAVLAALVAPLAFVGCGSGSSSGQDKVRETGAGAKAAADERSPQRQEVNAKDFHPSRFGDSANIDNKWLPLKPGTQWVFRGHTMDGKKRVRHRVIFTVTDMTKVIGGVRNLVLWDRDYSAGELVEAELAFFAQDKYGHVWHMGEYPEEYEEGKIVKTPAWIHGAERARAGVAMKAKPRLGTPSYAQGFGPKVQWFDRGKVYRKGLRTCVPAGCYEDVLVIDEFARDDPGAHQLKYYAPGVGNVRVGWRGNDPDKEVLVLVKVRHLGKAALAKVRAKALAFEERAYRLAKGAYGHTAPLEPIAE